MAKFSTYLYKELWIHDNQPEQLEGHSYHQTYGQGIKLFDIDDNRIHRLTFAEYNHNCPDNFKLIHRIDGPAAISSENNSSQQRYYWLCEGRLYSFDIWCKIAKLSDEQIVLLKLRYG